MTPFPRTSKDAVLPIPEIKPEQSIELLKELHILTRDGKLNQDSRRKLKQVYHLYHFIEPLLDELLADSDDISLADHGAGKSYLGFILYDLFFKSKTGGRIFGIETRPELVDRSRELAHRLGFTRMEFLNLTVEDSIASPVLPEQVDIVTALHACDTATDDAIHRGIALGADLIVVAPCCHKQIRREMETAKASNDLQSLTRHGIFMERQAEMVTDSLRALLLEYKGYAVKVFEFISSEHTAKNILIIAEKSAKAKKDDPSVLKKIKTLKNYFGIKTHHLEKKLAL